MISWHDIFLSVQTQYFTVKVTPHPPGKTFSALMLCYNISGGDSYDSPCCKAWVLSCSSFWIFQSVFQISYSIVHYRHGRFNYCSAFCIHHFVGVVYIYKITFRLILTPCTLTQGFLPQPITFSLGWAPGHLFSGAFLFLISYPFPPCQYSLGRVGLNKISFNKGLRSFLLCSNCAVDRM